MNFDLIAFVIICKIVRFLVCFIGNIFIIIFLSLRKKIKSLLMSYRYPTDKEHIALMIVILTKKMI